MSENYIDWKVFRNDIRNIAKHIHKAINQNNKIFTNMLESCLIFSVLSFIFKSTSILETLSEL